MRTLFEIAVELQELEAFIDEQAEANQGVIPEDSFNRLQEIEGEYKEKLEGIYKLINNKESEALALQEQERKFCKRRKTLERSVKSLKELVGHAIGKGNKFQYGIAKYSWKKDTRIEVFDEDTIPDMFCVYERKILKNELKAYLKEGGEVEGARLVDTNHLQVK